MAEKSTRNKFVKEIFKFNTLSITERGSKAYAKYGENNYPLPNIGLNKDNKKSKWDTFISDKKLQKDIFRQNDDSLYIPLTQYIDCAYNNTLFKERCNIRAMNCSPILLPKISDDSYTLLTKEVIIMKRDVDARYFKLRHLRQVDDTKYTRNKDLCRTQLNMHYLSDAAKNIEKELEAEQLQLEEESKDLEYFTNCLRLCEFENYFKLISNNSAPEIGSAVKLRLLDKQLYQLSIKRTNLQVTLHLDYSSLRSLRFYGDFLYKISPRYWLESINYSVDEDNGEVSEVIGTNVEKDINLIHTIPVYKDYISQLKEAKLYFKYPWQFMAILEMRVRLNFQSYSLGADLRSLTNSIQREVIFTKEYIKDQIDSLTVKTTDIKYAIEYNNSRADYLQKRFKDTMTSFSPLVISKRIVKMNLGIAELYGSICFGDNINMRTIDMVIEIVGKYTQYMTQLESIDKKIIKQVTQEFKRREKTDNIDIVSQNIKRINLMYKSLEQVAKPTLSFGNRRDRAKKLSQKICDRRKYIGAKKENVIKEKRMEARNMPSLKNMEYLKLFTEWCPGEDFRPFLEDRIIL